MPDFDYGGDTTDPWRLYNSASTLSLDSTIKYDGRNSAKLTFTSNAENIMGQKLETPIQSGPYTVSAWVRRDVECSYANIICVYRTSSPFKRGKLETSPVEGQWEQIPVTCDYTQDYIDQGELCIYFGVNCKKGFTAWIDSVTFKQ